MGRPKKYGQLAAVAACLRPHFLDAGRSVLVGGCGDGLPFSQIWALQLACCNLPGPASAGIGRTRLAFDDTGRTPSPRECTSWRIARRASG
jgi:hypothetical protein